MEESSQRDIKPMKVKQTRYSKEEVAQWGDALYESQVEAGNHGKLVSRTYENPK
jgi:hypothetical protein